MVLDTIYVVRHGFRSNWVVDVNTGEYQTNIRSPTGIASDPALAAYGTQQAQQLGKHLLTVDPPVDLIYSSPFYRCLQTLSPFVESLSARHASTGGPPPADSQVVDEKDDPIKVNVEPGLGEFYGLARFDHPSPATLEVLQQHFPRLRASRDPVIVPSTKGESVPQLHDRVAYCLREVIERADADPTGPRSLLICTHAASMITIGRTLTGKMPEDECEEDFRCFTCSFSKFVRKSPSDGATTTSDEKATAALKWSPGNPDEVPDIGWRGGKGVAGGWDCVVNGDCSFLENGEERGW
ncbi:phosphoglycerate mutase-like protein [Polychaeton citri CBS 116435]|uniref:Phosphoglycerate mutase-like protein n=1 Tax=Polychaeton citri CBS 116435 TaxID=1314669 RepID=A0A9P4UUS5_9PEZI|nr:phosphoglycerate mutase-like protein [Polychaeton citri CBS 116435]